jgi:L-iditol 2-dehydrogenase
VLKAAFLTAIGRVEVSEADEPRLVRPDDVLLRVSSVGVCGSDMHYYRTGRIGDQVVEFPFVVGHELSATVQRTGPDARGLAPGDRVAVDPLIYCGRCDQCLMGREHTCRDQAFMGVPGQLAGGLCERVVLPAACCHKVPAEMTDDAAALVEPFSIGLYATVLAGDVRGKTAAVLGSGPIGLSVLMSLRLAGAGKVYVTDIRDWRTALAGELGADWTGDPSVRDVISDIRAAEPGGVDFAFECAGEQETADQCARLLAPGGLMVLVGIPELDRLSFDMNFMRRGELRIQNVRRQNKCVDRAIELIASGRAPAERMVTHRFALDQGGQAFATVSEYSDDVVKAIIRVG